MPPSPLPPRSLCPRLVCSSHRAPPSPSTFFVLAPPRRDQTDCRDFNDNDRPLCQVYKVVAGDSATEIAQRFKVGRARGLRSALLGGQRGRRHGQHAAVHAASRPPWPHCLATNSHPPARVFVPPPPLPCPQVDFNEMLALNNLTVAAAENLPLNFSLKLPKWNETCPPEGIPAVVPSDTVR